MNRRHFFASLFVAGAVAAARVRAPSVAAPLPKAKTLVDYAKELDADGATDRILAQMAEALERLPKDGRQVVYGRSPAQDILMALDMMG